MAFLVKNQVNKKQQKKNKTKQNRKSTANHDAPGTWNPSKRHQFFFFIFNEILRNRKCPLGPSRRTHHIDRRELEIIIEYHFDIQRYGNSIGFAIHPSAGIKNTTASHRRECATQQELYLFKYNAIMLGKQNSAIVIATAATPIEAIEGEVQRAVSPYRRTAWRWFSTNHFLCARTFFLFVLDLVRSSSALSSRVACESFIVSKSKLN